MYEENDYRSYYRPAKDDPWEKATNPPVVDVTPKGSRPRKHRGLRIVAIVLVCALVVGGAFGLGYASKNLFSSTEKTDIYLSSRQPVEVNSVAVDGKTLMSYAELYQANVNSCVSINASATENIFGQEATVMASSGSGFIITKDGYIATNYHVISGSNNVSVTLYDGSTYDATIVGGDEDYDIAVLKIEPEKELTPVVIGDSSQLNVGDDIAVIGNPLGELTFSMSEGIVSTTNRLINVDGTPFNMIQITAAVNSGNSGGPLFNMYGELVGIVSAKLSSSGSSSEASIEGLGFAIPINDVKDMIQDIMTNGYVTNKPYLAIRGNDFSRDLNPSVPSDGGLYVYSVEDGGAAAKAGIQAGDVIVKIGDDDITSMDDWEAVRKSYSAGDTVTVEFYRGSEKMTAQLTFDSMPETTSTSTDTSSSNTQTPGYQNPGGGYYNPFEDFFGSSYSGGSGYSYSAA